MLLVVVVFWEGAGGKAGGGLWFVCFSLKPQIMRPDQKYFNSLLFEVLEGMQISKSISIYTTEKASRRLYSISAFMYW